VAWFTKTHGYSIRQQTERIGSIWGGAPSPDVFGVVVAGFFGCISLELI
jgi:hypothetical protein